MNGIIESFTVLDLHKTMLDLPPEILVCIFEYCDTKSLCRLVQTCRYIKSVVDGSLIWQMNSRKALATNQIHEHMLKRSFIILEAKDKIRLSYRWMKGAHRRRNVVAFKHRLMPWLVLRSDCVWVSEGRALLCFLRNRSGLAASSCTFRLRQPRDDITRFVCRQEKVVAASRDNNIYCWSTRKEKLLFRKACHSSDVHDVDCVGDLVLSGSRDSTVKIWKLTDETLKHQYTLRCSDMVLSVALSPGGRSAAVGTTRHHCDYAPIQVLDVANANTMQCLGEDHKKGAGVLGLQWETDNTLLSCGYDTYIRLWDLRSGRCEREWEDPGDLVVYCISTDKAFTLLSGGSRHGTVRLWDMRQLRPIKTFQLPCKFSSPVYSLDFDACQAFVALDLNICSLDFRSGLTY